MAIQMRRGQLANYDKSKMLPGEWGISIDNDSDNQKAFISFAPGVSKEVMMVEDAEEQIAVATAEAIDMATEEAEAWAHGNSFRVNDYASGDGSTKSFTLAETPSSIIGVYVDGSSVSAYTLSGKTITFTTAPASGSNNIRVYYTVNTTTDNAKYYKEQAEAVAESIPEDYSELSDDVDQLKNALSTKAEQDGAYPDLTAGQMLSKVESEDSVPYNFRAVGQDATLEYTDAIVGGSVVKNQLRNDSYNSKTADGITTSYSDGQFSVTNDSRTTNFVSGSTHNTVVSENKIISGHKYLVAGNSTKNITGVCLVFASSDMTPRTINSIFVATENNLAMHLRITSAYDFVTTHPVGDVTKFTLNVIDLTQALGTTIADYVYTLETATSGAGVAWLKAHFPKLFTYQEYNAGEIVSVQGLSEHVMRDTDNNIIHTYPFDDSLTLRGILKLDSNNQLYADGDRYLPSGDVERRYGIVDLGTLNWDIGTTGISERTRFISRSIRSNCKAVISSNIANIVSRYHAVKGDTGWGQNVDKVAWIDNYKDINIVDSTYGDDATAFKTAMSGVYLVYELETSTTETTDPYTNPQIVDPDGTEEYVSTSIVPVGHESRYPQNLRAKIEGLPWDLSMIAPIENGDKASQAYAIGKYFLHNNQFCKAKTAIASGATLTLNTNYEVTTVADEIYSALH